MPIKCPHCEEGILYLEMDPTDPSYRDKILICNKCPHFFPEDYFEIFPHFNRLIKQAEKKIKNKEFHQTKKYLNK